MAQIPNNEKTFTVSALDGSDTSYEFKDYITTMAAMNTLHNTLHATVASRVQVELQAKEIHASFTVNPLYGGNPEYVKHVISEMKYKLGYQLMELITAQSDVSFTLSFSHWIDSSQPHTHHLSVRLTPATGNRIVYPRELTYGELLITEERERFCNGVPSTSIHTTAQEQAVLKKKAEELLAKSVVSVPKFSSVVRPRLPKKDQNENK